MTLRARLVALFALAALTAGAGAVVVTRFRLDDSITHFLPPGADARSGRVLRLLARTGAARTTIAVIEASDLDHGVAVARAVADDLRADPEVAWVATAPDPSLGEAFHEVFAGRAIAYLEDGDDAALRARIDDRGLEEAFTRLRARLAGPDGAFVRAAAPADPFLVEARIAGALRSRHAPALRTSRGAFVTDDGRAAVLFFRTHAPAFDHAVQSRLEALVRSRVAALAGEHGAFRVDLGGVAPIAVATQDAIRADIERVSSISLAFLVLLFVVLLRSPRYLALAFLPLLVGTLAATAVVLLAHGRIHGLTLAFGSSLTGVSIDYSEHLVSHHALAPDEAGPAGTARRLRPGLFLGALTTVGGFVALGFARYPGIREIALFCATGVAVAFVVTMLAVPPFLPAAPRATRAHRALADVLVRLYARLARHRRHLLVVPALGLVVVALGAPRLRFDDDVRALGGAPPRALESDRRVRARVAGDAPALLVAVTARDDERALAKNDALARALDEARANGAVANVRSVHDVLWSRALQRRNLDQVAADRAFPGRLRAAASAAGFVDGAFEPFLASVASARSAGPLTPMELLRSPLAPFVDGLVLRDERGAVIVTEVRGVRDHGALMDAVRSVPGAHVVDRDGMLRTAYRAFRESTLALVGAGLVLVFGICWLRYRRLRWALAAFLPAVLAGAVSLAVVAALGVSVDLLHVIGLLLVLSMGVDYGVFVVESRGDERELGPTLASIVIAMSTTILSFGVLGMSEQPALRSIGTITALGVGLSVLFAPLGLLFAAPEESR